MDNQSISNSFIKIKTELKEGAVSTALLAEIQLKDLILSTSDPIILNSFFLKLADDFRNSNSQRKCLILQVFEETEDKLRVIMNQEELFQKIEIILSSIDLNGRILTLRLISILTSSFPPTLSLFHLIFNLFLNSKNSLEIESAIQALSPICARSTTYTKYSIEKISELILEDYDRSTLHKFQLFMIKLNTKGILEESCIYLFNLFIQIIQRYGINAPLHKYLFKALFPVFIKTENIEYNLLELIFELLKISKNYKSFLHFYLLQFLYLLILKKRIHKENIIRIVGIITDLLDDETYVNQNIKRRNAGYLIIMESIYSNYFDLQEVQVPSFLHNILQNTMLNPKYFCAIEQICNRNKLSDIWTNYFVNYIQNIANFEYFMANFYIPYKGLINKEFALQTIISWVIQQNLSPNFLSLSKFFLLIRNFLPNSFEFANGLQEVSLSILKSEVISLSTKENIIKLAFSIGNADYCSMILKSLTENGNKFLGYIYCKNSILTGRNLPEGITLIKYILSSNKYKNKRVYNWMKITKYILNLLYIYPQRDSKEALYLLISKSQIILKEIAFSHYSQYLNNIYKEELANIEKINPIFLKKQNITMELFQNKWMEIYKNLIIVEEYLYQIEHVENIKELLAKALDHIEIARKMHKEIIFFYSYFHSKEAELITKKLDFLTSLFFVYINQGENDLLLKKQITTLCSSSPEFSSILDEFKETFGMKIDRHTTKQIDKLKSIWLFCFKQIFIPKTFFNLWLPPIPLLSTTPILSTSIEAPFMHHVNLSLPLKVQISFSLKELTTSEHLINKFLPKEGLWVTSNITLLFYHGNQFDKNTSEIISRFNREDKLLKIKEEKLQIVFDALFHFHNIGNYALLVKNELRDHNSVRWGMKSVKIFPIISK